ncbi:MULTISPECIES: hypothetical protein [unclassified Thioalkalivibrio]|uniref:hypothetical protein n=1 Tax=unclassified Thioalkalivibrio TaxID=2621013 RepID=UPI000571FF18|nr:MULTISPECIES: hypothetical protein [unclassified Thioalkalivibrio]
MARVTLLLPGLFRRAEVALPKNGEDPPGIRKLARWLGRASPLVPGAADPGDAWETQLAKRLGFVQPDSGPRLWLARPVRLTPGMKDLVADPVDEVHQEEREALWEAARPELDAVGATLRLSSGGLWILEMEGEGMGAGIAPSQGLGRSMSPGSMEGDIARRLQILGNALQMAWFQHPVNQAREQYGRDPVHGLWLWSPGRPEGGTPVRAVCGGGPIAHFLADWTALDWSPDPASAAGMARDTVVVLDALGSARDLEQHAELMQSLADDVVQPLMPLLRRGSLEALEFHDPLARSEPPRVLTRRNSFAFWRRSRAL